MGALTEMWSRGVLRIAKPQAPGPHCSGLGLFRPAPPPGPQLALSSPAPSLGMRLSAQCWPACADG